LHIFGIKRPFLH